MVQNPQVQVNEDKLSAYQDVRATLHMNSSRKFFEANVRAPRNDVVKDPLLVIMSLMQTHFAAP